MVEIVQPYESKTIWPWENFKLFKERKKFNQELEVDFVDTREFLNHFRKKSFLNSDLSNYTINCSAVCNEYSPLDKNENEFCTDNNWQFVLNHEGNYAALLGFEMVDKNTILISQVQGVKGQKEILRPIKWPNALVNLVLEWAPRVNVSEVLILPSARNTWWDVILNQTGAKMYYDVCAKKEGFKYDFEREVFSKSV